LSDIDIEVILDGRQPHASSISAISPVIIDAKCSVEFSFLTVEELCKKRNSARDVDHWPYQKCVSLAPMSSDVRSALNSIVEMPPKIRLDRIKLHYWEYLFLIHRYEGLVRRESIINQIVVATSAVVSIAKVFFLDEEQWPPLVHWLEHNLRNLKNVKEDTIFKIGDFLSAPSLSACRKLIVIINRELAARQSLHDLLRTPHLALTELVTSSSFRPIREKYGIF